MTYFEDFKCDHSAPLVCDECGAPVSTECVARYDRNPNHDNMSGHYCLQLCFERATGEWNFR